MTFKLNKNQEYLVNSHYSDVINFMTSYGGGKTTATLSKAINDSILFGHGINYISLDNNSLKLNMNNCIEILESMDVMFKVNVKTDEICINREPIRFYTVDQILDSVYLQRIAFRIIIENADCIGNENIERLVNLCLVRLGLTQELPYYNKDPLKGQLIMSTSTPNLDINLNGYWFYQNFVINKKPNWKLIQSPLYDNPHLPSDYIADLRTLLDVDKGWLESSIEGNFNISVDS